MHLGDTHNYAFVTILNIEPQQPVELVAKILYASAISKQQKPYVYALNLN